MDIASRLDIPLSNVVRTPFYRPMLSLSAVRAPDNPIERTKTLARCLLEGDGVIGGETGLDWGGATMVYVTLQKTAEEVAAALVMEGVDARPYHAGLPNVRREVRVFVFFLILLTGCSKHSVIWWFKLISGCG